MATTAFFAMLCLSSYSSGLQLKIEGQRNVRTRHELLRRGNIDGTAVLDNINDLHYYTNLTLGGQLFTVEIDTGSADLWVAGNITDSVDTGVMSEIAYAEGGAKGLVKTSTLELAGYTVEDQAFMTIPLEKVLIGLGPTTNSAIYDDLDTSAGYTVLDHIFLKNSSTPNYLTVASGAHPRFVIDHSKLPVPHVSVDPTDVFPGDISIGELLDGYSNVESQPKLEGTIVPARQSGSQHFQVLLDQDGVLGPDGQPISITTGVNQTSNSRQATAMLDTGFSLSQVPKSVADAIYSHVSGAEYRNVTGVGDVWIVPCDEEVNITFKFSGNSYHIHPLDATMDPSMLKLQYLDTLAQFVHVTLMPLIILDVTNHSFNPSFQERGVKRWISFSECRSFSNVYAVFNYGDFVAGGNDTTIREDPYVQFLSTTDPAEAHSDFLAASLEQPLPKGCRFYMDLLAMHDIQTIIYVFRTTQAVC
ncbi:aspartic peptidase domain-containing protein [Armillaria mellea]|nr:aspartic peptidase domain-containing protein [Armillaria mellea]